VTFRELLRAEYQPWGELSPQHVDQLEHHYNLMESWNHRLNLTRIRDVEEVVRFHYCESLFVSTVLPPGPLKVADVGSGAGFPGIPLAVVRPEMEMTLIESDQRKAVFLREATRGLRNVRVSATRYQDCDLKVDWIVSRAVALEELSLSPPQKFAVLLSGTDAPSGAEVIKLPWGRDRFMAVPRETHVPRET
jgi:16S rRNA (guanine527-N7)-methyltransferase